MGERLREETTTGTTTLLTVPHTFMQLREPAAFC